ncbi:hypothetical protein D3C85_374840 [compost metagenome]
MDRPKILLLGDGPRNKALADLLAKMDFADVELRVLNDMVITGRGFSEFIGDELLHVDVERVYKDAMFAERYRHPQFDQIPNLRGCGKALLRAKYLKAQFAEKPADHPTRKREPKGPRGRWGKL